MLCMAELWLHYGVKVVESNLFIKISTSEEHIVDVLVGHILSQLSCHITQAVKCDSIGRRIRKLSEDLTDSLLRLCIIEVVE